MNKPMDQQKNNLEYWLLSAFEFIPIENEQEKKQLQHCFDMAKGRFTKEVKLNLLIDFIEKSKLIRIEIEEKLIGESIIKFQQEMLAAIIGEELHP